MLDITERPPRQLEVKPLADELPATFPRGRRCAELGCITVLNRYNGGPWCLVHAHRHERELAEAEAEREMAAAA